MANRYELRADDDGNCSIVDIFTGQPASYGGRKLWRIPTSMGPRGVALMNALDHAEREARLEQPLEQQ